MLQISPAVRLVSGRDLRRRRRASRASPPRTVCVRLGTPAGPGPLGRTDPAQRSPPNRPGCAALHKLFRMSAVSSGPTDFRLVFHHSLSDSYELSKVLLATADFDGTLQLLTSGWERALGYGREELRGKTLVNLMWSDRRGAAAAVAAILDRLNIAPVDLRLRCRDGLAKCFRLHRHYDKHEH